MAVPDYQSLMKPLLDLAATGQELTVGASVEQLARALNLSEQDRREMLPSGTQRKFDNRVAWACTYLRKAGLIERSGRGRFRITERGTQIFQEKPETINVKYLQQFPEFVEFRTRVRLPENSEEPQDTSGHSQTPQELLESSYQSLKRELIQELLNQLRQCSPKFFEALVINVLVAMGYGGSRKDAAEAVGRSGDTGIDGIIKQDRLGLDAVYIQAKRWQGSVGRPEVQAFAGSLEGHRARKGVFITTSQFTPDAMEYITRIEKKIVLIDGEQLAQLMIEHSIGVAEVDTYVVKRLDRDYFEEED